MNDSSENASQIVTVIFSWEVLEGQETAFMNWIHGIVKTGSHWPGHLGVTTLKPPKGEKIYQSVLRFDTEEHLSAWLNSRERDHCFQKLEGIAVAHSTKASGLETWFDLPSVAVTPPPKWKMVAVTFVALYPLSLFVTAVVFPHLTNVSVFLRSLLVPTISPILLTYILLPFLTQKVFKGWLYKAPTIHSYSESK